MVQRCKYLLSTNKKNTNINKSNKRSLNLDLLASNKSSLVSGKRDQEMIANRTIINSDC